MKCKHCGSSWDTVVQVKICPFCGKNLYENIEYTIASALAKVVEDCGLEMLHNSRKITAYIMDYVKGDERNKKLLRIAGNAGIFDLLYEVKKNEDKGQQKLLIGKALKVLEEDAFLSTENAIHIMEILAEGLSLEFVRKNIGESGGENERPVHENTKTTTQFESRSTNSTIQVELAQKQSHQTKEEYLTMLVDGNKRVTKEENEEIFLYGRKLLRQGQLQSGIKWIRFASNHGLKDADFLLGYCYEQGIGVGKDANVAQGFYRNGTISNPQFDKYYRQGAYGLSGEGFRKAAEYGKNLYGTIPEKNNIENSITTKTAVVNNKITEELSSSTPKERQSFFSSFRDKLTSFSRNNDDNLQKMVDENAKCTNEECQAIFELGRKRIQKREYQQAIKLIRYAVQHGHKEANFLLAYCYEQGIGVGKDSKVAEAYYRQGIISNSKYSQYQQKYGFSNMAFKKAAEEGEILFKNSR